MKIDFKNTNGFTLIELIVSIAIIGIMSAVAMAGFSDYGERSKVDMAAYKLVSDIRMTQNNALSLKEATGIVPSGGWGLSFSKLNPSNNQYIIFADDDGSGGSKNHYFDNNEIFFYSVVLPEGVFINELVASGGGGASNGSQNISAIVFEPPEPTGYITGLTSNRNSAKMLNIEITNGIYSRNIIVNVFGLVDVMSINETAPILLPDPAVYVSLSTDKPSYTYSIDNNAALTANITDENGEVISGLGSTAFNANLPGITFSETATDGTYSANLDISAFSEGEYNLTVDVTDGSGVTGAGQASFTMLLPDPAVYVSLSTDKPSYTYSIDNNAVLTANITDEYGEVISGLGSTAFNANLSGITFSETATNGTYSANLDISTFSEGEYNLTVDVMDGSGVTGAGQASFTIVSVPVISVVISDMSLVLKGVNHNVDATVLVTDENTVPVEGVLVSGIWGGDVSENVSGTTDASGQIVFSSPKLKNPQSGIEYNFTVTGATKVSYQWDGVTVTESVFIP